MNNNVNQILRQIDSSQTKPISLSINRGLEKESLRVNSMGNISQEPHPVSLGAALTNAYITTDYSEALLEFITPANNSLQQLLRFLQDLHKFTHDKLDDEILWVNSMPSVLEGENSIPIAYYGESNIGKMKTIYRQGLAYRYGKIMQTIAGIHFNFSLDNEFWINYHKIKQTKTSLKDFKSEQYLGLIRNLYRYDWVIAYFFGASPAVSNSFLINRNHQLEKLGNNSFFLPNATSLRLSDLGYWSEAQSAVHLSLNHLSEYTESLLRATTETYGPYKDIGIKVDGQYKQLTDSILQIENEYYASVRPKRTTKSGERPSITLRENGVEYIELRSLDLNPFLPLGIDESGIRFLDLLMLECLFQPSPPITLDEFRQLRDTRTCVAERGREPDLTISDNEGQSVRLTDYCHRIFDSIESIGKHMDQYDQGYSDAVSKYRSLIDDKENTPSAQALNAIHDLNDDFTEFGLEQAKVHRDYFSSYSLGTAASDLLNSEAKKSADQADILKSNDTTNFDTFLKDYFGQ